MRRMMTAAEAKSNFSQSLRFAERGDQVVITRYGKPVAALVSAEEMEQLERLRASTPADGLAALVGRWEDSDELVAELERVVEARTPPRARPDLD